MLVLCDEEIFIIILLLHINLLGYLHVYVIKQDTLGLDSSSNLIFNSNSGFYQ